MSSTISLTILGSGTSTGVPAIGCDCAVCSSTNPRNHRTRCSGLIRVADRTFLIDTSTDLRTQALREQIAQVDAVLYTHSHADHVHGIDDLRCFNRGDDNAIPVYGDQRTVDGLKRTFNYIFGDSTPSGTWAPQLTAHRIDALTSICDIPVTPIPLVHGQGQSQGYRIGDIAYLTDCSEIPPSSQSLLEGVQLLVLDGLRHRPHSSHMTVEQACHNAEKIGAVHTVLTHLSHDIDYERDGRALPPGVELAWDGLTLTLPFACQGE